MKKKILLLGNNWRLIKNFFVQLDFYFDCLSSSMIYSDMKMHMVYFDADAVVYCMNAEKRDDMVSVVKFVEDVIDRSTTPFIAISDNANYEYLSRLPNGKPDFRINLSESISEMQEQISSFIAKAKTGGIQSGGLQAELSLEEPKSIVSEADDLIAQMEEELGSILGSPKRPRILIIDDSTIIHKTIKNYLKNNYDISSAISGLDALRFLETKEVNLILLDYEMPQMDGAEVLKVLKNKPSTAGIPVVFLTGINDATKIQKVLALKPDGYLLKPIDQGLLMNKIKDLIG